MFIKGRLSYRHWSGAHGVQFRTKEFNLWTRAEAHAVSLLHLGVIVNDTGVTDAGRQSFEICKDRRQDIVTVGWNFATRLSGEIEEHLSRMYRDQLFRDGART